MFKLFDDDNSGVITFKNLQRVARELGENLTDDELQEMVDEADRDGMIQVPFVDICIHPRFSFSFPFLPIYIYISAP